MPDPIDMGDRDRVQRAADATQNRGSDNIFDDDPADRHSQIFDTNLIVVRRDREKSADGIEVNAASHADQNDEHTGIINRGARTICSDDCGV